MLGIWRIQIHGICNVLSLFFMSEILNLQFDSFVAYKLDFFFFLLRTFWFYSCNFNLFKSKGSSGTCSFFAFRQCLRCMSAIYQRTEMWHLNCLALQVILITWTLRWLNCLVSLKWVFQWGCPGSSCAYGFSSESERDSFHFWRSVLIFICEQLTEDF